MGVVPTYARGVARFTVKSRRKRRQARIKLGTKGSSVTSRMKALKALRMNPPIPAAVTSRMKALKARRMNPRIPAAPLADSLANDAARELSLIVPAPSGPRETPDDALYVSRDGQQEFRANIIAAYGRCAVTGCRVVDVLEAAHIIPYVNAASNLVVNGLCLRADIHKLYDRNLIWIEADCLVQVNASLTGSAYATLQGRKLLLPPQAKDHPDRHLLAVRHRYIKT